MRVAQVSSVGQCGISVHSEQMQQHVEAADASIRIEANAAWLDPLAFFNQAAHFDLVHLNYHRGLHSRWAPEAVQNLYAYGDPAVVITFHDSYEVQPDLLPWDLLACPNVKGMVVHEECDLSQLSKKVHYMRQPCPSIQGRGWPVEAFTHSGWRPTLGTLGFDFPWKNYSMLAKVTGELGWNLRIAGKVEDARQQELLALNPCIHFDGYVQDTADAVAILSSCDATAFMYTCGNSGTSGAIRVGMTAGKPLVAAKGCRQFADLEKASDGWPITWIDPTETALRDNLSSLAYRHVIGPNGFHLGLIALAHQERWEKAGQRYAELFWKAVNGE